jgi:protein TonB
MPRFLSAECESKGSKEEIKQCAQGEMLKFIYKNIKYPPIARENGVEGTVVIRFVVDKNGNVKEPEILRDIKAGCGAEAMRVVNMMPKWKPGQQRGRKVPVYFNLPVKFKLE